jgi:hypothetical protein
MGAITDVTFRSPSGVDVTRLPCAVKLPGGSQHGSAVALQQPQQLATDDALLAPLGVAPALAFGRTADQVGAGVGLPADQAVEPMILTR